MTAVRKNTASLIAKSTAQTPGIFLCCLCLLTLALFPAAGAAHASPRPAPYSLDAAVYRMADPVGGLEPDMLLALTFTPQPGFYTYASPSQAQGRPTKVSITDAQGLAAAPSIIYPRGEEREDSFSPGQRTRIYPGPVTIAIPLQSAQSGGKILFARYSGLLCSATSCTPFDLPLQIPVPPAKAVSTLQEAGKQSWWPAIASGVHEANSIASAPPFLPVARENEEKALLPPLSLKALRDKELLPEESAALPTSLFRPVYFASSFEVASLSKALLLGFFAGLLLNVMPCVLPVLGFKLAGLLAGTSNANAENRKLVFRRYQIFFALGILAWFTVLAVLLASLGLLWGQIFQRAELILGLAILLLLLACSLFGVFSLPILDFRTGSSGNPKFSAFMNGVTATLLATPCSGPLLGGVLSWALLQPLPNLVMAMLSVGLGMSSPYILLAARPGLIRYVPRPGPWMRRLEQLLAFLFLAATAYLVTLLPAERLPQVLGALVLTGFAAWLWGQIGGPQAGAAQRILCRCLAAALIVVACIWPLSTSSKDFAWETFDEKKFQAVLGKEPLFVEFTADWCPTCKIMESATLTPARMADWQKQHRFTAVRVDLTQDNPAGQSLLRGLGSSSIPLLAFFPAGENAGAPLVLRDMATPGQVQKALKQAFTKNRSTSEDRTHETLSQ